jgi:NADPH:quinone reductase
MLVRTRKGYPPEVGPNEVLIHVEWAGVGQWDPFEREGVFVTEFGIEPKFPYVLDSDGAGTVVALGDRVKGLQPGDRVYAFGFLNPKGGFYAEYAAVNGRFMFVVHFRRDLVLMTLLGRPFGSAPEP